MINEERVKELYQMALFDQKEEKQCRQMGEYYRNDYISKELIKSFFSGTIVFGLLLVLWVLNDIEGLFDSLNGMDYVGTAVSAAVLYIAFIAVYLLLTAIVYYLRYSRGRRHLKKYYGHLKKVDKMYEREDKLKI